MSGNAGAPTGGILAGMAQTVRGNPAFARLGDEAKRYAFAKAEQMVDNLTGRIEETGKSGSLRAGLVGAKAVAEGKSPARASVQAGMAMLKEKVKSVFRRGKKGGGGKIKVTNIEENIDIGLPVDQVYNHWTEFEEFNKFMKGVEGVERTGDTEANWRVRVFKSRRTWKATIQEMVPDRRIVWTSEGAKGSTRGVVTFHPLADDLTRVLLVMEYYPAGLFEKVGNIWRAGGRRARLDLKHFRRHTMMAQGEPPEGWRGEIRNAQLVRRSDEEPQDEDAQGQERQGGEDENPQKQQQARRDERADEILDRGSRDDREDDEERPRGDEVEPGDD
ncbi:SRPBCC family protein [Micromonospora olivasterospora]|uniref:Polyketide cyclase/dehydrase/lipid transport protein n=1 Tax=Micromonospora olivasterospora TaxID=1880 RepID=A0A562IE55_MICOL|nr:SRPBCC family protein [Micromonospora olivasterospora]TWH69078.1 polyketide cyclase/dehydrase/lipid transport protein [Micromonospora olivasterospora]